MLHLSLHSISTFFECEMKISFINIVSELKNMESRIIAYKQEPKKQTLFAISSFNIRYSKDYNFHIF